MNFVLDLIILAIIVVCALISAKKGFVKTIIRLVGWVLALVLSITFSGPLAELTYSKAVEPAVVSAIDGVVSEVVEGAEGAVKEQVYETLPEFIKNNIDISEFEISNDGSIAKSITESAVQPIATTLLRAIFSIILFIVLSIAAGFLAKVLNKIFSFSILGKANKILGGVVGAVQGIIFAVVFVLVVTVIVSLTGGFLIFTPEAIEKTVIFNLIAKLLPSSFLF